MAPSVPATISPLAAAGTHRGHGNSHAARRISPSPACHPSIALSSSPAISSILASAGVLKPKSRGLGLRCRATEETPPPTRVKAPLKVMISGAPASGKGTQCRMIVEKVKSRLDTYKKNSEAILPTYSDLLKQVLVYS
nr:unnamed protein product [Digitaria exilis]